MKRNNYGLMIFIFSLSLVLNSCNKDISDPDELIVKKTSTKKSHTVPTIPIGVPPDESLILNLQNSGSYYYCNWAGTVRVYNIYNPTDYTGMVIKRVEIGGEFWNVVPVTCGSATFDSSWTGELDVIHEKFILNLSYCASKTPQGSCAEWKVATQTKILVKVLNPDGIISSQFALIPQIYLQDGPSIE